MSFPPPVPAGPVPAAAGPRQNFPGPKNIIKNIASIHLHLLSVFGILEANGVHTRMPLRAKITTDGWRAAFDIYFGNNGQGRAWLMWDDRKVGLTKWKASVLAALEFHASRTDIGSTAELVELGEVARRIMGQRNAAIAAADATAANMLAHQQDLNNMNRGMGLLPNERGVAPPPGLGLGVLPSNVQLALNNLSARTRSSNNHKFYSYFFNWSLASISTKHASLFTVQPLTLKPQTMPMVQTTTMMRYKLYPQLLVLLVQLLVQLLHLELVLLPLVQLLHLVHLELVLLARSPMVFREAVSLVISRRKLPLGLRSSLQLDYVRGIPITLHFWVK